MTSESVIDYGHLDSFDGVTVTGWARSTSSSPCDVDIFLDGKRIGTTHADQFRADLQTAGIGDGCHTFFFTIPPSLFTGRAQSLSVKLAKEGLELQGSPIAIIGEPSSGPAAGIEEELVVNPGLRSPLSHAGSICNSGVVIAPGIWVEASKNSIDISSYSCEQIEGLQFSALGSMLSGVRIRSPLSNGHVRLFFEMTYPRAYFASPATICFAMAKRSAGESFQGKVAIGFIQSGRFHSVWSRKIQRLASKTQELSFPIPAEALNKITAEASRHKITPAIIADLTGSVDVTISPPLIFLGRPKPTATDGPVRAFEDGNVQSQWDQLRSHPNLQESPKSTQEHWTIHNTINVPEIIVPIFNAPHAVEDCLKALRKYTSIPHLLTIVDDGSFQTTADLIDQFAKDDPWCRVIRNAKNEGYTYAINRAIKSSSGNVIVILNSDTIVTPEWLSGLLECLNASEDTGMAGALSNAASWQSVPRIRDEHGWCTNKLAPNQTPESMANEIRQVSIKAFPAVPVLNGFCMAIKKQVFDTIGIFDEITFPQGYGEENDFCLRATDAGFKLRIADHVYVYHHKSASFGSERRKVLSERANQILSSRYGQERMKSLENGLKNLNAIELIRNHLVQQQKTSIA